MRASRHVKRNDQVLVIAGKSRGKRGRVLRVVPKKNGVIVEGVALIKRHTRPNPQKNIKGGIVEKESPIHVSNLMVVCGECGNPSRLGYRRLEDGGRIVRFCRKCNGLIDK